MNLHAAAELARTLMNQHGFYNVIFEFSNRRRALGTCHIRNGRPWKITLSKHWTPRMDEPEVRDVILHEIAHAYEPLDGHGYAWKAACRRIGAKPDRVAKLEKKFIKENIGDIAKYKATCVKCGNEAFFYRLTRLWRIGGYVCSKCRGKFTIEQLR